MNIGIIGYGKMGSAIFRLLANKPHDLIVLIRDEEKTRFNERRFFKRLERSLKRGTLEKDEFLKKKESLRFTHRLEDLASAEIVIEATPENYEGKVNVFNKLEEVVDKSAVIVTNTSSIPIQDLVQNLKYRDRFCGLHFFHPVPLIGLVEIIKWADTPDNLIQYLRDFCKPIGRQAIVVNDAPGSAINAILAYYYVEAAYILEEGLALPSKIDELAKRFFYIGPCESMDVIGLDFFTEALERAATRRNSLPRHPGEDSHHKLSRPETAGTAGNDIPYLFRKLISQNRLGKQVSGGIYIYQKERPVDDTHEFYMNLDRVRTIPDNAHERDELISKRLLYSIFNGSMDSLQRAISSVEELDLGMKEVLLMKEGPFTMMKAIDEKELIQNFAFLSQNIGKRFKQTNFEFLKEMRD